MPSLLDHLAADDGTDLSAVSPPAGLLDTVKADGARRRADRHRRNLGIAVLALVLLAVPAVGLRSGEDGRQQEIGVAAGGDGTVTTAVAEPIEGTRLAEPEPARPGDVNPPPSADEPAPADYPPPSATPTTAAPAPPPPPTATTTATTAKVCRNSADSSCGAFRWDPAPAPNKPLVASFTNAPATAVVGQPVAFEVAWSDGDAQLSFDRFSSDGTAVGTACSLPPRFGPWTPPPVAPGSGTRPYQTTFNQPGAYRVIVSLGTADCTSPYGNDTQVEHTITVTAAP